MKLKPFNNEEIIEIRKRYEKDFKIIYMPDNQFIDNSAKLETLKIFREHPYENVFVWPKEFSKFNFPLLKTSPSSLSIITKSVKFSGCPPPILYTA